MPKYGLRMHRRGAALATGLSQVLWSFDDEFTGDLATTTVVGGDAPFTVDLGGEPAGVTAAIVGRVITISIASTLTAGIDPFDILITNAAGTRTVSASFDVSDASEPEESTTVTTHTIRNTSGSEASGQVYVFGQPFRRGDIPSTHRPLLTNASDADLTWQMDEVSTWDDGSLRHAAFSIFAPTIAGSGAHAIKLKKEAGAYSRSAARTTADFTALDFNVYLEDVRDQVGTVEGSGMFKFSVNNKIAAARKVATGPVRDGWLVQGDFQDNTGGADHDHLFGMHWFDVFTSPSNPANVHGVSHIPMVCQPWINRAGAKAFSFKTKLRAGATVIRDYAATTWTFTSANVDATNDWITLTGSGLQRGEAIKISTSGALPAGVSANTLYFIGPNSANLNQFRLYTAPKGVADGATTRVNITDGGSGTHTVTRYNAAIYRQGFFIPADDLGNEHWTANQPTLRPDLTTAEKQYWEETGMIPPFDLTVTTATFTSIGSDGSGAGYRPGANGFHRNGITSPGDTAMLGPLPRWVTATWYNMTAGQLDNCRANALVMAHWPYMICLNEATERMGAFNNGPDRVGGSYATLGAPMPVSWYLSHGNYSGFSLPMDAANWGPGTWVYGSDAAGSHRSSPVYFQYMLSGRRHFLDLMYFSANHNAFSYYRSGYETSGRITLGATTFHAKQIQMSELRQHRGWKENILAAACGADANPEKLLQIDVMNENCDFFAAYLAWKHANWSAIGNFAITRSQGGFMYADTALIFAWGKILHRHARWDPLRDHVAKWMRGLWDGSWLSPYFGPAYYTYTLKQIDLVAQGDAATTSNYASTWDEVFAFPGNATFSFATNGTVTLSSIEEVYKIADGDEFKIVAGGSVGSVYDGPTELDPAVAVYFRDVNHTTRTCKFAYTPGGAAITYAVAKNNMLGVYRPQFTQPTGSVSNYHLNDDGYHAMARSALAMLKIAGASDMDTAYNNCDDRWAGTFASQARYAMVPSVTVP